jgi:hypothetical protein
LLRVRTNWPCGRRVGSTFFLPADADVLRALTPVSQWATTQGFKQAAVSTFLQVADYYLVGHALAHQHTIVTHEVPANSVNVVKVPTACVRNGVPWMTPYEMLRRERARFILGP